MNIEIEYKFLITNKSDLLHRLNRLSKSKFKRQYQSNVMFDNPSCLMQKTNGRVRVRTLGDKGQKVLTYKKPLPSKNGAKQEIEYEISFVDANLQIEKILQAMEFLPTTSYERYQTKWQIGKTAVTLDEYPFAIFLEIEGDLKSIQRLAQKLNFDIANGLTDPADTLFQKWRKNRNLPFKSQMRFDDFDK